MLLYPDKNEDPPGDGEEIFFVFFTERMEDYLALSLAALILIIILLFF
ncbi:hypothetical protein J2Z49_000448 [Desulfofundulus luciae]|uniref:Uncharacterized protein n=1 Tax=Desulfofundulus luciae TaxID=74702 RepID=A0ABU0AZ94_9FIRM|nr:hypothetical protein [Desulfofundulus luciae]MDQ0285355.1 hypothetical protein [Desulfofundulus luciae]